MPHLSQQQVQEMQAKVVAFRLFRSGSKPEFHWTVLASYVSGYRER